MLAFFLQDVLVLDAFTVSLPIPLPSWKPPVMFKTLKKGGLWLCTCPFYGYMPRAQTDQVIDVLLCCAEAKKRPGLKCLCVRAHTQHASMYRWPCLKDDHWRSGTSLCKHYQSSRINSSFGTCIGSEEVAGLNAACLYFQLEFCSSGS